MIKPTYRNYSGTTVFAEKTQADISKELRKYGIERIQHTYTENGFSVSFQADIEEMGKPVTIRIDIPHDSEKDTADKYGLKDQRIKYRVLYYYIKALLTAWDCGLKSFIDIFMPYIVLPGGRTISQQLLPKYKLAIENEEIGEVPLLGGGEQK
jgi:hypothetical protein